MATLKDFNFCLFSIEHKFALSKLTCDSCPLHFERVHLNAPAIVICNSQLSGFLKSHVDFSFTLEESPLAASGWSLDRFKES